MEAFFTEIIGAILGDGSGGVTGVLMLLSAGMGWFLFKREHDLKKDRRELIDQFQRMIESDRKDLLEVIEKYQEGQISVIQAINEIRVLIATIGAKI